MLVVKNVFDQSYIQLVDTERNLEIDLVGGVVFEINTIEADDWSCNEVYDSEVPGYKSILNNMDKFNKKRAINAVGYEDDFEFTDGVCLNGDTLIFV